MNSVNPLYNDYMETPNQDLKKQLSPSERDLYRLKNNAAGAKYREANRELIRDKMRKWRDENRDKISGYSKVLRDRKFAKATPEEVVAIRTAESKKSRLQHQRNKDAVFEAYGGYKCACCGEEEQSFLSIDHIDNDGHIQRKNKDYSCSGTGFYSWLRKNEFPPNFQVLCMNCQIGKHKNGGVCPHQVRRNDYPEREYTQVGGSAQPLAIG